MHQRVVSQKGGKRKGGSSGNQINYCEPIALSYRVCWTRKLGIDSRRLEDLFGVLKGSWIALDLVLLLGGNYFYLL